MTIEVWIYLVFFAIACLLFGYLFGMSHWGMKSWNRGWRDAEKTWIAYILKYDYETIKQFALDLKERNDKS